MITFLYVDPGISGMVFQIGYVVFYGFIGLLAIFFKPLKRMANKVKEKITGKKSDDKNPA